MNKGAPLLEVRVHNQRHEVVLVQHVFENLLHFLVLRIILLHGFLRFCFQLFGLKLHQVLVIAFSLFFLLIWLLVLLLVQKGLESREEAEITVGDGKVRNGGPIVN